MIKFSVGDTVRATGLVKNIVLYEGKITRIVPLDPTNEQFCTVEIAEGSGFWSDDKWDTILSSSLQKIDTTT